MTKKQKPIMVYAAGPMDDITDVQAASWRDELASNYPHVLFFMPNRAYSNAMLRNAELVRHMNNHAINCSHGVIANLLGPGRGFGTIREIEFAVNCSKPVALACNPMDIGPQTLMTHDITTHIDIDSAMLALLLKISIESEQRVHPIFGMVMERPPDEEEDDD